MHVQSNGGWLGGWLAGRPKTPPPPPPPLAGAAPLDLINGAPTLEQTTFTFAPQYPQSIV